MQVGSPESPVPGLRRGAEPETWDLWLDGARAPALNMALDEALVFESGVRGRGILRLYGWDRPAVSIGCHQVHAAGVRDGWALVRRPTGGGVVLHDADLTYTVAVPAGHWLTGVDREASYGFVNRAVAAALARGEVAATLADASIPASVNRRTMVCFSHPTRYDIVAGGRKVAGAAQRRTAAGILHQGSIRLEAFRGLPREAVEERIVEGFIEVLGLRFERFEPGAGLLALAHELAIGKYGSNDWNRKY